MGHIAPATGRNKRETSRLARRGQVAREARAQEADAPPSGAIRKSAGKPVEKRVEQKRRNKVYPPGRQPRTEFWQRGGDAMTCVPAEDQ
jgi:hypothetical protein